MLLASKGPHSLGPADRDLLDIVCSVTATAERYRGQILHAQAEIARRAGSSEIALGKARELCSLPSPQDRFNGLMVEALVLRSKGDLDGAMQRLRAARELSRGPNGNLECETAETLIQAGRLGEAKEVLDRLIFQGAKDGDELERIFFPVGDHIITFG